MPLKTYVLDSYALLAMLEDQPGAELVADMISEPQANNFMSVINLGEVLYIIERRRSRHAAVEVKNAIQATEGIKLVPVSLERAVAAAEIKAGGNLSYADCYVAALAKEVNGVIVTGDPEFSQVEMRIKIKWLP